MTVKTANTGQTIDNAQAAQEYAAPSVISTNVEVKKTDNSRHRNQHQSQQETKKYLWFFSLITALVSPATALLYIYTNANPLVAVLPLVHVYLFIPMMDLIFGEDPYNPSDDDLEAMEADPFYRRLVHASVPVYYASFLCSVWFVGSYDLPLWSLALLAWGFGSIHGNVLTIGHELGHKTNRTDKFLAQAINGMIGYGHFCIEHNRGHHVAVSTPDDPASARMGESVYAFARRELPGALKRGWAHERDRLTRKGRSFWSTENEILQSYSITLLLIACATALFGWKMVPFLIAHHVIAWFMLTQANYIEHYGLLREKRPNGKYVPVEPRHSWNTNHVVSNLLLFHLQRHSDHHANPMRPYQTLRNFENLPQLPSGYPGCFALAICPPIWFRVMNPRVMEWAGGDLSKVNVAPEAYVSLAKKYQSGASLSPA